MEIKSDIFTEIFGLILYQFYIYFMFSIQFDHAFPSLSFAQSPTTSIPTQLIPHFEK